MFRSLPIYLFLLAMGSAIVFFWCEAVEGVKWPYSADSAEYIEAAKEFSRNSIFTVSPRGVNNLQQDAVPLTTFPAGYSLLISISLPVFPDAAEAGKKIGQLSWILLPCAIYFALRCVLGARLAISVAGLISIAPGLLNNGYKALSDTPFLLLAILSIGAFLRSFSMTTDRPGMANYIWLLAAGFTTGFAYLIRNAGVALIVALLATIIMLKIVQELDSRKAFLRIIVFMGGLLIILAPNIIYNLIHFGAINPYLGNRLPPDASFLQNFEDAVVSMAFEITTLWSLSESMRSYWLWLVLVVVIISSIFIILKKKWDTLRIMEKVGALVLSSYLIAGVSVVIISASVYSLERIGSRFMMQYEWGVMAILLLAIGGIRIWSRKTIASIVLTCLGGILLLHALYAHSYLEGKPQDRETLSGRVDFGKLLCAIPVDALLFSNEGLFLTIEGKRRTRHMHLGNIEQLASKLSEIDEAMARQKVNREIYFVLLPLDLQYAGKNMEDLYNFPISIIPMSYDLVASNKDYAILKRRGLL